MSVRENILNAISAKQPDAVAMPVVDIDAVIKYDDVIVQFKKVLENIGGKAELVNDIYQLKENLNVEKASGAFVVNTLEALGVVDNIAALTASQLEKIETAYIQGVVAVAENGAVWVNESCMINRLLPFICEQLVLVVEKKNIVATMHQAYQQVDIAKDGFGVFIAGPSKTADIEQSLVIGAHGPKKCTVFIINN